ncbi:MAG: prepilin-type N-terminal cleavage/methylation domain-containing protein [Pseudomonadota bacterium]
MRPPRRGFSLLEVIIALALVGVALVAVIRTQGQGIRLSEEARFTAQALFLARQILAESQADPENGVQSDYGDFKEPLDFLKWQRDSMAVPGLPGLHRVTVFVQRKEQKEREGVTLETFIYRPTGE